MIARHQTLELNTQGNDHILDITGDVQSFVSETGVRTGQVVIMVQGSTGSVTTLEFEPGLVNHDMAAAMERLAPRDGRYVHEETWHDDNGHSHVRASTVGPALSLPVVEAGVPLGTWQQIVFMDFDTRARRRTLHMSVVGV